MSGAFTPSSRPVFFLGAGEARAARDKLLDATAAFFNIAVFFGGIATARTRILCLEANYIPPAQESSLILPDGLFRRYFRLVTRLGLIRTR